MPQTGWGPIPFIPNPVALGQSIGKSAAVPGEAVAGLVRATAWISNYRNWVRIAYVAVGSTIVVVGLAAVVFGSKKVAQTGAYHAQRAGKKAVNWAGAPTKTKAKPAPAASTSSTGSKAKKVAKKAASTAAKVAVVA